MMRASRLAGALCAAAFGLSAAPSFADAGEARFFDGVARRAFEHGEYSKALDAFLQVQAVAPSPRAVYNVAVCAELAKKTDAAFAYYRDYLAQDDPDAERRRDATQRLSELKKNLALVEVTSEPPGASVHVDRKELGVFGVTPTTIVVPRGERQLIFELPGHGPETQAVVAAVGVTAKVEVKLTPRLGELVVDVTPANAKLEFLREKVPVEARFEGGRYSLPVGQYRVRATAPGRTPGEARAIVREGAPGAVSVVALPVAKPTGKLLVGSGEIEAEVRLDGRRVGVTPATLPGVTVGAHTIEVRGPGGKVFTTQVTVTEGRAGYVEAKLGEAGR